MRLHGVVFWYGLGAPCREPHGTEPHTSDTDLRGICYGGLIEKRI